MAEDRKKSLPPESASPDAARVGQDLLAQLHNDFVVHKQAVPVGEANKGAQLGQDLLAQFAHDFGSKKKAEDAAQLHAFGQQLLGAVARDFGSVRPPSIAPGTGPHAALNIPVAAPLPSFGSSPGSIPAPNLAPPPGYVPPAAKPLTLAPPPSAELLKAEEALAKIESAPLAQDEAAEVEAMQGRGALGFLRKLLKR